MSEKSFEQVLEEEGFFVWKSEGSSMLPLIREHRDQLVIEKRPEGGFRKYDVVLFRRNGVTGRGAYVLHRILRINPDGSCWIVGDHCYQGETVKDENILGILTAVIRKGKKITLTEPLYRFYTHLWCDCYPVRFLILRCGSVGRRAVKKLLRLVGGERNCS